MVIFQNPIASAAGIVGSEDKFQGQSTSQATLEVFHSALQYPCSMGMGSMGIVTTWSLGLLKVALLFLGCDRSRIVRST